MKTYLMTAAVLLLTAGAVYACTTPLYQSYHMTGKAEQYQLSVFVSEKTPIDAGSAALIGALQRKSMSCNVTLQYVDCDRPMKPELKKLWMSESGGKTPWLLLSYPSDFGPDRFFVSQELKPGVLRSVLDSPLRRELASRLQREETAGVFLLMDSGNKAADAAARRVLQKTIIDINTVLSSKDRGDSPAARVLLTLPSEILENCRARFSVMRIPSDSRDEIFTCQNLRMLWPELVSQKSKGPVVFLIAGKGLVMVPLKTEEINIAGIHRMVLTLLDVCSCTLDPDSLGHYALISADWQVRPAPASNVNSMAMPFVMTVSNRPVLKLKALPAQAASAEKSLAGNICIVLGAMVLLVGFAGAFILKGQV